MRLAQECVAVPQRNHQSFRTKLSFRFGGLITLFHRSISVQGSQDNITSEKTLKRVCLCTLLSPHLHLDERCSRHKICWISSEVQGTGSQHG
jgi:hypothetical protein